MKPYKIGIDTGGTYTDAVVFDPVDKKVLKSVKALTSHGRLELGIVYALKDLFQDKKAVYRVSDIGLVSLSTTLATNSLVEKKERTPVWCSSVSVMIWSKDPTSRIWYHRKGY